MPLTRSQAKKLQSLDQFAFGAAPLSITNKRNGRKRKRISNETNDNLKQSPKLISLKTTKTSQTI